MDVIRRKKTTKPNGTKVAIAARYQISKCYILHIFGKKGTEIETEAEKTSPSFAFDT